jgi:anti-repressor protein
MNHIPQVFKYIGNEVRTVLKDNEIWFCAKDVCDVLEISNSRHAMSRIDDDEKGVILNETSGGIQKLQHVNEPGLYSLILGSRKHEAKIFKRWITHEVIPAIRKHSGYLTAEKIEEALTDPDVLIQLATNLKAERIKRQQLEQQALTDKPKLLFAEALEVSGHSILIGELAKLISQNGIDIGQNRLFQWLRENGFLIRKNGEEYNNPSQRSMTMDLFEIKKRTINNNDGSVRVTRTTKVTPKGQRYFINKFIHNIEEA